MDALLRRNGILWLLAVSLVFNLAFLLAYVFTQKGTPRKAPVAVPVGRWVSADLCERMGPCGQHVQEKIRVLEARLIRERQRLADILTVEPADRARLARQVEQIASIQGQVQLAVLETLIEERSRLEPGDRAHFDVMVRTCMSASDCAHAEPACVEVERFQGPDAGLNNTKGE